MEKEELRNKGPKGVTSLISTSQISKQYKDVLAVDKVSMHINAGEIYGLIGKNGAGKTTLFRLLLGLSFPTSGGMTIFQADKEQGMRLARKKIGSFVGSVFYPYLSAKENLSYYCKVKGADAKHEVPRLLKLVDLADNSKPFSKFSMGMKQRLGLATALIGKPEMMILDEPTNGLDPEGIVEIREIIQRLNQEQNITFMVSSHILSELSKTATTFGFLDKGRLVKEMTQKELQSQETGAMLLKVGQVEKALQVLKQEFSMEEVTLGEENELMLPKIETEVSPHNIARALVECGVDLYAMQPQNRTLEDYFFELVGR